MKGKESNFAVNLTENLKKEQGNNQCCQSKLFVPAFYPPPH